MKEEGGERCIEPHIRFFASRWKGPSISHSLLGSPNQPIYRCQAGLWAFTDSRHYPRTEEVIMQHFPNSIRSTRRSVALIPGVPASIPAHDSSSSKSTPTSSWLVQHTFRCPHQESRTGYYSHSFQRCRSAERNSVQLVLVYSP